MASRLRFPAAADAMAAIDAVNVWQYLNPAFSLSPKARDGYKFWLGQSLPKAASMGPGSALMQSAKLLSVYRCVRLSNDVGYMMAAVRGNV